MANYDYSDKIVPLPSFLFRLSKAILSAIVLMSISLTIGVSGYHFIAELSWLDAFMNACMIFTGMGPVDHMQTSAAKLFASFYALFSGFAFLTSATMATAPLLHRLLHGFHLEERDTDMN